MPHTQQAIALMTRFADRSGLAAEVASKRYLWTDAFAVCNFLGLECHVLALQLVDRVHHTLGRHRPDDTRTGWISGLDEETGAAHPTLGGLRIGKPLPERRPTEPANERLEWDRDGQYFHYLTKWMHALDQVAIATGRPLFNTWARELAEAAHRTFVYGPTTRRRMYWKMSIDLTRPQVASMGHHDPLDGYVTCKELAATAATFASPVRGPDLSGATADFASMIQRDELATGDPLGLGGLLVDAYRLVRVGAPELVEPILAGALAGLRHFAKQRDLDQPADRRLAFRELGLAIGLAAVMAIREDGRVPAPARAALDDLVRLAPIGTQVAEFWSAPGYHRSQTWVDHADINEVMLATALAPQGFLRR